MRLSRQKYLPVFRLTLFILLSCSFLPPPTSSAPLGRQHQIDPPILKSGLIATLQAGRGKITSTGLIKIIKQRGVAFQLTPVEEQEIRSSGEYLGQKGLDELVAVVRASFRPPRRSPFRVTYTLLESYAIDYFLQGKISRRWNANVGGNSYIVKNNTFKKLSFLVNTFSEENSGPDTYYVQKKNYLFPRPITTDSALGEKKKYFVGSGMGSEAFGVQIDNYSKLLNSMNDPKQSWRAFWTGKVGRRGPVSYDATNFVFRKFNVERSDLELLSQDTNLDFLLYITSEGVPPDFGYFEVSIISGGSDCGAHARGPQPDYYSPQGAFFVPTLDVLVAVVENVSKEAVSIKNFIVKENDATRLRPREDDWAVLEKQPNQRQPLYPRETLEPGEKIAIALEMIIGYDMKDTEEFGRPRRIPGEAIEQLKNSGGLILKPPAERRRMTIKAEVIEKIASMPPLPPPAVEYVYGPSVALAAIEIDERDYIVREYDPKFLLITSEGEEAGSCPYVYTYSAEQGRWLEEGVILPGINEKYKEATDEKLLRGFDGRILINEKDPEDSFIDSMFIRAIAPDGRESILYPQNARLRFSDAEYLKLKQGDQVVVDFDLPKDFIAHQYVLVTRGYYVPYKMARARRPTVRTVNKLK